MTSMCVITSEIGDFYKARKFFESHKNYMALDFISDGDYKTAVKNNDITAIRDYMPKEGESKNDLVNSRKYNYICITDIGIDSEYKVMYCNNMAMDYLQTVINELYDLSIDEYDCIMLLPDSIKESSKEEYINYMKEEFKSVENYFPEEKNIRLISYKPKNKILCMQLSGEFDYLSEPVICISSDTNLTNDVNEMTTKKLELGKLYKIEKTEYENGIKAKESAINYIKGLTIDIDPNSIVNKIQIDASNIFNDIRKNITIMMQRLLLIYCANLERVI